MKYWNKQKPYRLSSWTTAKPPQSHIVQEAKRWCQQQPSKSKFYFHYSNTRWWFEDKHDALQFTLIWSHHG